MGVFPHERTSLLLRAASHPFALSPLQRNPPVLLPPSHRFGRRRLFLMRFTAALREFPSPAVLLRRPPRTYCAGGGRGRAPFVSRSSSSVWACCSSWIETSSFVSIRSRVSLRAWTSAALGAATLPPLWCLSASHLLKRACQRFGPASRRFPTRPPAAAPPLPAGFSPPAAAPLPAPKCTFFLGFFSSGFGSVLPPLSP